MPAGNSVALRNLLRLAEFTGDDEHRERAERGFAAFGRRLTKRPSGSAEMLVALDYYLDTPKQVVLVTPGGRSEADPLLARLRRTFLPNRILSVLPDNGVEAQAELVPLVSQKSAMNGEPTAYVCEEGRCELPTSSPETFARQIAEVEPLLEGDESSPSSP